jgi:hypothetical protein
LNPAFFPAGFFTFGVFGMLVLSDHGNSSNVPMQRRTFLRLGALGLGGLTLADLLRSEAQAKTASRPKSLIYIVLAGGPSHIDMYDLKPNAPEDYRGPFKPIATSLNGVQICEHMPCQARIMDKLALLRGVKSIEPDHFLSEVYSGLPRSAGKRPAFGSVVSRLVENEAAIPPFVNLNDMDDEFEMPSYLGAGYAPFHPFGSAIANMKAPTSIDRLQERKQLHAAFDTMRRDLDQNALSGLEKFQTQAFDIITSPQVRNAFDLSREPQKLIASYGKGKFTHQTVKTILYNWDSRPFLLARRLVEAGVRVVSLRMNSWDHHPGDQSDIFLSLQHMLPALDRSFSALINDLEARGLDQDVMVVMVGEFGRSPKIMKPGVGRDHWADAGCAVVYGGGLQMGQVIGETDSRGERAKSGKMGFQNIMATIYRHFGIDPQISFPDFSGRPQNLLADGQPIQELLG